MRDSFHDDRALDRVMREKFPMMALACRDMSPEAVLEYIAEMRPHIVREHRLERMRAITADRQQRL